jgi:predicted NAD/FAD-dependent oxidoreductase
MTDSVVVVGAGMAGLLAARTLQDAGYAVVVLDKGRGVGGRMATRRFGKAVCDHGAQFMTVRDPTFQTLVRRWQAAGVLTQWCLGFSEEGDGHPRYRGTPSMTAVPKFLASSLTVRLQQRVVTIALENDRWCVKTESGENFFGGALILTAPVPQSLALLAESGVALPAAMAAELTAITYEPCLAVVATLDSPGAVPPPGAVKVTDGVVSWLADNQAKGISPVPSLTIHASSKFSRTHLEGDLKEAGRQLIEAVHPWLGASRVMEFQVHRWRYSKPIQTHRELCVMTCAGPPLALAGDAFGGSGRIEGAALSGLAAAEAVAGKSILRDEKGNLIFLKRTIL